MLDWVDGKPGAGGVIYYIESEHRGKRMTICATSHNGFKMYTLWHNKRLIETFGSRAEALEYALDFCDVIDEMIGEKGDLF
jgi:hypothetical protein